MNRPDTSHLDLERLGDFVDGRLDPAAAAAVTAHLAVCDRCAAERARLEALLAGARSLPEEIDPPAAVWNGVREHIGRRESLGAGWPRWRLAAAAVLLVALSSAITAWLVGRHRVVEVTRVEPSAAAPIVMLPAAASAVDANYALALSELTQTLAQRRSRLDPATVAKVETSLGVVDRAIGEARGALAADPANRDLVDLLAASYERKLELLRRASELLPST